MPNGFVPLLASYSQGPPDGVLRTDVAGGAARYALEWARGRQQYGVTLLLDQMQFMVWSAWFHRLIDKGALTFSMRIDSGFGPQPHDVNMIPGTYQATRASDKWIIGFSIETESQAYLLTPEEAAALVELYNQYGELFDGLLARIARFANVDSLVLDF
jgi:hypothetical protein